MDALNIGSIVQNISFYVLLLLLAYANYCLIAAGGDEQRGRVFDHILPGLTLYRRIFRQAGKAHKSRADLLDAIDQQARKEKMLEERIAGLENVLERITDPLYLVDRDWNFTYINKKYEQVQGRDRDKLLGRNVWELFPYGKEHCYFKQYDRALREQVSVNFEEFNTFNGMWVSASAYPVKSGLAISFRDITEEKIKSN